MKAIIVGMGVQGNKRKEYPRTSSTGFLQGMQPKVPKVFCGGTGGVMRNLPCVLLQLLDE